MKRYQLIAAYHLFIQGYGVLAEDVMMDVDASALLIGVRIEAAGIRVLVSQWFFDHFKELESTEAHTETIRPEGQERVVLRNPSHPYVEVVLGTQQEGIIDGGVNRFPTQCIIDALTKQGSLKDKKALASISRQQRTKWCERVEACKRTTDNWCGSYGIERQENYGDVEFMKKYAWVEITLSHSYKSGYMAIGDRASIIASGNDDLMIAYEFEVKEDAMAAHRALVELPIVTMDDVHLIAQEHRGTCTDGSNYTSNHYAADL